MAPDEYYNSLTDAQKRAFAKRAKTTVKYIERAIVDESPNSAQCQKIIMAFKDGQWVPLRNMTTAGALNDVLTFVNELEAKKYVQATKGLELFTG